jgi:hypothetical protein
MRAAKQRRLEPRGLCRVEAAAYFGLSPSAFDKARREGKIPGPTLPGGRYDFLLLESHMNKLSRLEPDSSPSSPLQEWKKRRGPSEH